MTPPSALFRGFVAKLLGVPMPDSGLKDQPTRLGRYGGIGTDSGNQTRHALSDEGSYLVATSNLGALASPHYGSFSATTPFTYIFNTEPAGSGKSLFLDYIKITSGTTLASTFMFYAVTIDVGAHEYSSDLTSALIVNTANGAVPTVVPLIKSQNSAGGGSTFANGFSANSRRVARGGISCPAQAGDVLRIHFGSDAGMSTPAGTASARCDQSSPVVVPPQHSATLNLWWGGVTTFSYEIEIGMWAR